jgi:2-polyprenyl-3-methyl-5-hydroxy-6-metoxy-1,4-benzoquinol methylase
VHVLEHFVNPYEVLAQIRSLLKNGGVCVIEVPNLRSLKFMLAKTKWKGGNHPL